MGKRLVTSLFPPRKRTHGPFFPEKKIENIIFSWVKDWSPVWFLPKREHTDLYLLKYVGNIMFS